MYKIAVLVLLLLLLSGCSEEQIVSDVDQTQANEIVAVLNQHGMVSYARKGRAGLGKYAVYVSQDDYSLAISLLHAHQLPRTNQPSFKELTTAQGFIPNSREVEALRLDHALGLEIEEKLRAIPGVKEVKVAVRSHSAAEQAQIGATVIINQAPEGMLNREEINRAVELLVPGIAKDRIQLIIEQQPAKRIIVSDQGVEAGPAEVVYRPLVPFLYFFQVPVGQHRLLAVVLLFCIVITALSCCVLGFISGRRYDALRRMQAGLPEAKIRAREGLAALRSRPANESPPSQRYIGGSGTGGVS